MSPIREVATSMTCPLIAEAGHLFLELDGQTLLVDTGSPTSFAANGTIALLGDVHSVGRSLMGLDAAALTVFVGRQTHGLLGMDLLGALDVLFDVSAARVTFSRESVDLEGDLLSLDDVFGVPVVSAHVNGRNVRLFVDSGAQLGYLRDGGERGGAPAGRADDFYPGVGSFTTNTWNIETRLGTVKQTMRMGELPGSLSMLLMVGGVEGIMSNAVFTGRRVALSMQRRHLILER